MYPKEIIKYLETNETENTTYQNLGNTPKAVLGNLKL